MNDREEPDWLAELAKGGDALRCQIDSAAQAAEQFGAQDSARPLARRITRAVDAAIRELRSAGEPVIRHVFDHDTAAATDGEKAIKEITGALNIPLPPGAHVLARDGAKSSQPHGRAQRGTDPRLGPRSHGGVRAAGRAWTRSSRRGSLPGSYRSCPAHRLVSLEQAEVAHA